MIPEGIIDSEWPRVHRRLADMAITYDMWQQNLGELTLGLDADNKYAATVGGVALSIPRQVGKTFTIGSLMVALCVEFPNLLVLWTAHHGRTITKTFESMQAMVKRKRIAPHLAPSANKGIRTSHGEQEIRFANGSAIMFGAREQGFGRGFDAVDVEIFDEAQILSDKALEDMIAATNQARHEHGALVIYMGTPPRPGDKSDAFTNRRNKALFKGATNMVYVECSADPGADPDDRKQWEKANPSYPHHTPVEAMLRMREHLPSVESWMLEAYGIWPDPDADDSVIDLKQWAKLTDVETLKYPAATRVAMVVDVSPDRKSASIGVAGDAPDGRTLISVLTGRGSAWVVPEVQRLSAKEGFEVVEVAVQPTSAAGLLIPDIVKAGIEFEALTATQMGQATAAFIEGVKERRFAHLGQSELDAAVDNARTRLRGEAEIWDRRNRSIDISPLVAVSAAAFRWAQQADDTSVYESRGMVSL